MDRMKPLQPHQTDKIQIPPDRMSTMTQQPSTASIEKIHMKWSVVPKIVPKHKAPKRNVRCSSPQADREVLLTCVERTMKRKEKKIRAGGGMEEIK